MLVIEDNTTGEVLQAADDEELFRLLREHHSQEEASDDELRERIAREAYEATDS